MSSGKVAPWISRHCSVHTETAQLAISRSKDVVTLTEVHDSPTVPYCICEAVLCRNVKLNSS